MKRNVVGDMFGMLLFHTSDYTMVYYTLSSAKFVLLNPPYTTSSFAH